MLMANKRSWIIIVAVTLLAALLAFAVHRLQPHEMRLQSGSLYPQPRAMQPFDLLDQHGVAFTTQQLQNKWSFLFFGYTHCPDVCPTTLSTFAVLQKQLPAALVNDTQFIFVTVDPARDPPAHMQEYVEFFFPQLIGLTGSDEQVAAFARDVGVAYMKVVPAETDLSSGNYTMDHSVRVFLINPAGERYAMFAPTVAGQGYSAAVLLQDYLTIRQ